MLHKDTITLKELHEKAIAVLELQDRVYRRYFEKYNILYGYRNLPSAHIHRYMYTEQELQAEVAYLEKLQERLTRIYNYFLSKITLTLTKNGTDTDQTPVDSARTEFLHSIEKALC